MYKKMAFSIKGIVPLMLHNPRLANPRNPIVRSIKAITGKRKKTDEDLELLSALEWIGGLYTTEEGTIDIKGGGLEIGGFGKVCVPGENIEAAIKQAARQNKMGKQVEAGLLSEGPWPLTYDGPSSVSKLSQDPRFTDIRNCGLRGSQIMRTRPIFKDWALDFEVSYLPDMLNPEQIADMVNTAGKICAIGTYRPKFGRFEVTDVKY